MALSIKRADGSRGWELSDEEYVNLLTADIAADYAYGVIYHTATMSDGVDLVTAQEFARNLLDEWIK